MFIVDTIEIFLLMWFVQKYDRTAELNLKGIIFADGPLLLGADILKIVCLAYIGKKKQICLTYIS